MRKNKKNGLWGNGDTHRDPTPTPRSPWQMQRWGHPQQDITMRHHENGFISQVFEGNKMVGHFTGHNAQNDARRHAFVTSQASYEKNGNPNWDTYSSQTN